MTSTKDHLKPHLVTLEVPYYNYILTSLKGSGSKSATINKMPDTQTQIQNQLS